MATLNRAETIVITGASRGIGAYLARGLATAGRTLLLTARRKESLYDTARACTNRGAKVVTYAVELSDVNSIEDFIARLAEDGHEVDMLVNNAGVSAEEVLPWEGDPETWWKTQEINLRAPYLLQHGLVPAMLKRGGGRIVDLSSGAAVKDTKENSAYNVSKTALMRLAGSLHESGHELGLRVFSVAPGVVQTDMTKSMRAHDDRSEWNEPTEVAEIIRAIADAELDGLSGTQLRAGTDTVDDLRRKSETGVGQEAKRLRLTSWDD